MESQATPSGASAATPATLSDLNHHTTGQAGDPMGLEIPEQLLTPENSRSETSSNTENALNDEKSSLSQRRKSTRVTRASLQKATVPADSETDGNKNEGVSSLGSGSRHVSGETLVSNGKKSHSSLLRHSLAVMESSQWSETTLARDDLGSEDQPMVPDTPVSSSSQEQQLGDTSSSLQHRALRKRMETGLVKEGGQHEEKKPTRKSINKEERPRRSSRLSLVGRTSGLVWRAGSVLGKWSREVMDLGKDLGQRGRLRPRHVLKSKEEPAAAAASDVPAGKKRRVSDGDLPDSKDLPDESIKPMPIRYKPKRWESHGLYIGQTPTDSPPRQRTSRTSKRSTVNAQRKYLPMPMFVGARLFTHGRDFQLPFDIFSPLPPGQPKPDEWRKTNKNVFVGEAGSIWRANKPLELSKCLCTKEAGCDENCQNRYMFYECDDSNCGLGRECGNRSFEELKQRTKAGGKYNVGVEVIKTPDRGYGVRSNRTFEANQIIVEYTGEILTQTECERRMRTVYKDNECYYLMYFDQNMIIDATRGSIARFVNHSCEPNCRMEKWTVAGKPRMALFAGERGIMTGEELSYDYNFDPYSQRNVQECRCGSEKCRGVLGPRPKEQRAKDSKSDDPKPASNSKRTRTSIAGTKRKNSLDDSSPRLTKRRRALTPQSIKTGIKNAASKARSAVSRSTTRRRGSVSEGTTASRTATKTRRRGRPAKGETRTNRAKSPVVEKTAKAKTAVRANAPARGRGRPKTLSTGLTRPSAETKAKILAKGATARRRLTKEKETDKPQGVRSRKGNNQYTKGTAKPRTSTAGRGGRRKS